MIQFNGDVVIVTGAVGRLGSASASVLHKSGARAVLIDRNQERLNAAYPDLLASKDHLLLGDVDLARSDHTERFAAAVISRFGRIDGLVNTVGGFRLDGDTPGGDSDTWKAMLDLNVQTTLNAIRAVLPSMQERGRGRIVSVASRAALKADAGVAAYSSSKSAVVRLTESLSSGLKSAGIHINCVLPNTLDTPENAKAMPDADRSDWVNLDALAELLAFLVSDGARALNGAAIPV